MLDVIIEKDAIRIGDRFAITFQRTLRIPDDGRAYPLPPGLGRFPILPVAEYADRVPPLWRDRGGVFIPMYQREALWLGFHAAAWKPSAVKIAVGGINVISGQQDDAVLHAEPQDYVVCPDQPWIDGIHNGEGSIRQFVAMALGSGYTVEAAITGTEQVGGLQITVFDPRPGRFPDEPPIRSDRGPARTAMPKSGATAMGLGAGGTMKQRIYPDAYGIETWDQGNQGRILVHIVNSAEFFKITGQKPPPTPIHAGTYTRYGLPWFELYDEAKGDVRPSERLTGVKTISEQDAELGEVTGTSPSFDVPESQIRRPRRDDSRTEGHPSSTSNPAVSSPKRE